MSFITRLYNYFVGGNDQYLPPQVTRKSGKCSTCYIINDDHKSFMVRVNKQKKTASLYTYEDTVDESDIPVFSDYTKLLELFNYKRIFIGNPDGNTILIQLDDKNYIFIGRYVFSFKTNETITKYTSPIESNGVSYPFAVGEKNVYLMNEEVYKPITNYPYEHYYKYPDMWTEFKSVLLHEQR